VFSSTCAECHGASEFRGTDFLFRWRRQSAWDLFRNVSANMPENAPGSLEDEEYADVIAWILELNGHMPGHTELTAESSVLDGIPIDPGTVPLQRAKARNTATFRKVM